MSLEKKIEKLSAEYASLNEKRTVLEEKVVMLRPGSINRDLLEERARHVLGFIHPDERILFDSDH
jgi:cell division protein FtsB